jgi:hypothetical protein
MHAGEPLPEDVEKELAKKRGRTKHKHVRVVTESPAGSDPTPAVASRSTSTANDAQLKADKPPHY